MSSNLTEILVFLEPNSGASIVTIDVGSASGDRVNATISGQ